MTTAHPQGAVPRSPGPIPPPPEPLTPARAAPTSQTGATHGPPTHATLPVAAPTTRRTAGPLASLTLRTRMVFLVVALLVLGLAISTVAATTLLRSYLIDQLDRQLVATASAADGRAVYEITEYYAAANGLPSDYYFRFQTAAGQTLKEQIQPEAAVQWGVPDVPILSQNAIEQLDARPFTVAPVQHTPVRTTESTSSWRVLALSTVNPVGDFGGTFVVALPLGNIQSTTAQLTKILGLACLSIALLGGVAGYIAVRRSLQPLRTIEATARAIADGDLGQRVPPMPTRTEVGSLAASLNVMLGQIEHAFEVQAGSEARMRQFVADASHELRTPLVSIRGYSELYRMGALGTPAQVAEAMDRIEGSAIAMGRLVEDLLALARLEEGETLHSQNVDMAAVARDTLTDLAAIDPTRATSLVALGGSGPVPDGNFIVRGDEARLRQVLTNLIGNVLAHTPAGSPVEIAVGREPRSIIVEVRDHGQGIAPEHRERVFERFHRVDASRNSSSGGSGLGLAIVATIVAAHDGSVRVDPTPGGGATFRLALAPVPPPPPPPAR